MEAGRDQGVRPGHTVIARWLGNEDTSPTHIYMEADLAMKGQALSRLQPVNALVSGIGYQTS